MSGQIITIAGGTDSSIAVTLDGSQAISLANQFKSDLDNYYQNNNLNILDLTENPNVDDRVGYGLVTDGGIYSAGNGYDYIVVGGYNTHDPSKAMSKEELAQANLLNSAVTINSVMTQGQFVNVLSGDLSNFTYNAGQENGNLAAGNIGDNVVFNGNTVNGGNWNIATGQGDDTVITGSGNNTVNASTGNNFINITAGNRNVVNSTGHDSIFAAKDSNAQNTISINGAGSQDAHTSVDVNKNAAVYDFSSYNTVTVGGGSTIAGGSYGTYTFDGSYDSNQNLMTGGLSSSITAVTDLQAVQGNSNTINASQSLSFFNGIGDMNADVQGQAVGFGADGLNYTLNATGAKDSFFTAGAGNETLNASGSTSNFLVYSYNVAGADSNFVASGGSGNDTLVGGTGNSTFSGGAGDNLFLFTKETAENGNTVITDFSKADKIGLYDFGLDNDSLQTLLQNSQDGNNAVLRLEGHTITIEGVSVSDLTIDQFQVNNTTKTS